MFQYIKAGGSPQKKKKKKVKPTAICLLCSLSKDIQSPQAFFINNKKVTYGDVS